MRVCGNVCDCNGKRLVCINPHKQHYAIYFDERSIDGERSYAAIEFDHLPDLEEIKNLVIDYYNKECDAEIVSGFRYEDTPVWLSTENQFNYKAAWDLAVQTKGATLPIKFKFGTDAAPVYREFTTLDELKAFYVSAIGYVNEVLQKYWHIKDNIDWSRYEY